MIMNLNKAYASSVCFLVLVCKGVVVHLGHYRLHKNESNRYNL